MSKLVGVVEKPQFDTEILKPGKAIHIKRFAISDGYKTQDVDGLIGRANPLALTFYYYNTNDYEINQKEISIDSVTNGEYEITVLKEEN
ncbi:hypothetical protein NNC19_07345 [Clostridium sp. SHJSY1]|uniref:hypothetical protein n=1 Tax=Clostridium sp. SHJSY1 TaxID=2942483 RepID=UPI0028763071|nr:hypothetical protein [Clostridium sp. SHJSY1]MDS0525489.1 hypothetical protein [Clostridium sp. SHJSY1]